MSFDEHVDDTSALLTKTQREWLRQIPTFDPDSAPQRARRSKLRKRLVRSIYDFEILFEGIPERDYETVFETLQEDPHGSFDSLSAMIAFVYAGTTESHRDLDRGPHNFREILARGVSRVEAERSLGERSPLAQTVSVEFEVEKRQHHDLDFDKVFEKIENGDVGDLTSEEVYGFINLYRKADDPTREGMAEALEELRNPPDEIGDVDIDAVHERHATDDTDAERDGDDE